MLTLHKHCVLGRVERALYTYIYRRRRAWEQLGIIHNKYNKRSAFNRSEVSIYISTFQSFSRDLLVQLVIHQKTTPLFNKIVTSQLFINNQVRQFINGQLLPWKMKLYWFIKVYHRVQLIHDVRWEFNFRSNLLVLKTV